MLIKAKLKEKKEILTFLYKNIEHCLYLYIDISYYGLDYPYINVWIDRDEYDDIVAVVMKYHENFQIYFKNVYNNVKDIAVLLKEYMPPMINGEKSAMQKLQQYIPDVYFSAEGKVMLLDKPFVDNWDYSEIEKATLKDINGIATLICNDDYYKDSYEKDELVSQLTDRMKSNMGRNYIVRDGNKIIAHNSISAQVDNICVGALLIVHADYRKNSNYGFKMEDFSIEKIKKEGKKLYAFLTDEVRIKALSLAGNNVVSEYKKFVLKK